MVLSWMQRYGRGVSALFGGIMAVAALAQAASPAPAQENPGSLFLVAALTQTPPLTPAAPPPQDLVLSGDLLWPGEVLGEACRTHSGRLTIDLHHLVLLDQVFERGVLCAHHDTETDLLSLRLTLDAAAEPDIDAAARPAWLPEGWSLAQLRLYSAPTQAALEDWAAEGKADTEDALRLWSDHRGWIELSWQGPEGGAQVLWQGRLETLARGPLPPARGARQWQTLAFRLAEQRAAAALTEQALRAELLHLQERLAEQQRVIDTLLAAQARPVPVAQDALSRAEDALALTRADLALERATLAQTQNELAGVLDLLAGAEARNVRLGEQLRFWQAAAEQQAAPQNPPAPTPSAEASTPTAQRPPVIEATPAAAPPPQRAAPVRRGPPKFRR